jgi:phospholipid/cholesterol/gamma-HCH transport system substrate-binding protein
MRLRGKPMSPLKLGTALIVATVVAGVLVFAKDRISIALSPTSTVKVHLAENYGITPYATQVKVAGIKVGDITDVSAEPGGVVVTVEADTDLPGKLRTQPSARVRPTTLLGGNYFLDLVPGGTPGELRGDIPKERTTVPVEMDKITRALQPNTLTSLQHDLRSMDGVLSGDSRDQLQNLLADAPDTLGPAGGVLQAARGTNPASDLPNLVGGLERTGQVLSQQQGQLASTIANLSTTSTVLGDRSRDITRTLSELPSTLDSANAGLTRLDTSLNKLKDTADPVRPVAWQLNSTIDHLDPALAKARPLVGNANTLLNDARPLVEDLNPTAKQASAVLDDVRGPVLDRLDGPIKNTVLSPFHGTGHYQNSGSDRPLYQELAYMITGMDRLAQVTDANGATIGFGIGASAGTLSGLPISLEQLLGHLTGIGQKEDR